MPVHNGKDSKGSYYKYGDSGKKYYYTPNDKQSRDKSKEKARKQEQAIYSQGYREK